MDTRPKITAPHARHTWQHSRRRRAFLCRRCDAMIPSKIVEAADKRADMLGLTLDEVLDRLLTTPIKAARS